MIQRIQTVYLLVIVLLMVTTLFLPLATLQVGEAFYSFDAAGVSSLIGETSLVYPTWGLFIVTVVIALIAMVTIFLFKNRILQIRLSVFNALLMIGFYAYAAFVIWQLKGEMENLQWHLKFAMAFPLISIILDYLAIRNIGADEALVRSLDRLR
ncbi:MAG: DUF4293 domain-containing protein [Parabacteroides sp.]